MKKQLLLLAVFCGAIAFGQNTKNYDSQKMPVVTHTIPAPKLPTKPAIDLTQYQSMLDMQNLSNASLYRQYKSVTDNITSQKFESANAAYDSTAADDFTVPSGEKWKITDVTVNGTSTTGSYPTSYNVVFYSNTASNLPGTAISTQNVVLTAGASSPTLPLATPVILAPGKYWVSVQAVLNLTPGGQWFWNTYTDSSTLGAPFAWLNPGNGFATGCNTVWTTASTCITTALKDLQFSLNGELVVPCKTFSAKIATTDPTQTGRTFRDAVPSTCPTPKAYPGDLTGTYHYKTHSITNATATNQCVTVALTNPDAAAHVFLVAYNGSFNPANLSQNYLADSGTSAISGSPTSMDVVVPPNATVILVTSEVTANSTFSANYTIEVTAPNCSSLLRTAEGGKAAFTLYPNPTSGTLFVNGLNPQKAQIIDASGKSMPAKISGNQIDMEKVNKGTYLIQLQDKAGNTHTEKVIKK